MTDRMASGGRAFLLFGNDVPPAQRAAYEHWHAAHHVPQRLTVPGILGAIRFRAAGSSSPQYLTLYRLAEASVTESPEYRALVEAPDAPTLAMRPFLVSPVRFVAETVALPRVPDGYWMAVETSASAFPWKSIAPLVVEGRLVADQRNHPIMGQASLPRGLIRLGFASPGEVDARLPEGRPGQVGGFYRPLDRYGFDAV